MACFSSSNYPSDDVHPNLLGVYSGVSVENQTGDRARGPYPSIYITRTSPYYETILPGTILVFTKSYQIPLLPLNHT